jgi:CheY-like chemotaxis protein
MPLTAPATSTQLGLTRKKILVVDDSFIIRKTLMTKLKSSGYDVLEAADGGTAVSIVRRERPDLVLLDLSFPPDVAHGGGVAWDGFLIMAWLQRMDEAKDIPIMIVTAGEPEKFKARALKAGAVGFFQKPINNDELLAAIRRTFGEDAEPSAAG